MNSNFSIGLMLLSLSMPAIASVNLDMKLLSEKIGLCEAELNSGKSGGHCESLEEYSDYLFKGNTSAYISYHLDNGTINDKNIEFVIKNLKMHTEVMQRLLKIQQR